MSFNQNEFNRNFEKLRHEVQENLQELTREVEQEHKLEDEVKAKKAEIMADQRIITKDESEISRLKPHIRQLENEKRKVIQEVQMMESKSRTELNKNISNPSKMIKPLGH